jgi:4-oxalmesaconate hydratase
MIIDIHGHFTQAPRQIAAWRVRQIAAANESRPEPSKEELELTDDDIRASIEPQQLAFQHERGTDLVLFSPTAGGMAHHNGSAETSRIWTELVNENVHRVCTLWPDNFVGVCQLPQSPGVSPANCIAELERCVTEWGFVGCNINPDPSDGYWTGPPITDPFWYPLYEKMVELEVPAMIHSSSSCNPVFHGTGAHYINGDTTAFMQLIQGDLFREFPTLKFVIPHGGGAVPYQWGRYWGIAHNLKKPPLEEYLLGNVFFDSCIYDVRGMQLLTSAIPAENILFASEMIGAVNGTDPRSGHYFDDTKRYFDQVTGLSEEDRHKILEANALRVYPRLARVLAGREGG